MADKGDRQHPPDGNHKPSESSEHTLDSATVQGQAADQSANARMSPKGSERGSAANDGVNRAEFDVRTYKPKTTRTNEMLAFDKSLNSLLSWKEELKLLTLDANINHSYYEAWVEEANRIFIRCVSLRKRLKRYASKGG